MQVLEDMLEPSRPSVSDNFAMDIDKDNNVSPFGNIGVSSNGSSPTSWMNMSPPTSGNPLQSVGGNQVRFVHTLTEALDS